MSKITAFAVFMLALIACPFLHAQYTYTCPSGKVPVCSNTHGNGCDGTVPQFDCVGTPVVLGGSGQWAFVGTNHAWGGTTTLGNGGGDITSGFRVCPSYTPNAIYGVRLMALGTYQGSLIESLNPNPLLLRASIEYPAGNNNTLQATFGGQKTVIVYPNTFPVSDTIGVNIAQSLGANNYCKRTWWKVPSPPTSPAAATSTIAGALASTTYYYVASSMEGFESGPSGVFSQTTSGANSSLALSWTAPAATTELYTGTCFYRSTVAACASSCFRVGCVPAGITSWVDQGLMNSSIAAPTVQLQIPLDQNPAGANSGTSSFATGGGNTADITGTGGALAKTNSFSYQRDGTIAFGGDTVSHPVALWADTLAGFGIVPTNGLASGVVNTDNWYDYGMASLTASGKYYSYHNFSNSGPQTCYTITSSQFSPGHNATFPMGGRGLQLINEIGGVDIFNGVDWQQLAGCDLRWANALTALGGMWFQTTLGPEDTTSNDYFSVAGETLANSGYNTQIQNFNAWLRNGARFTSTGQCLGYVVATTLTCVNTTGTVAGAMGGISVVNGTVINSGTGPTYTVSTSQTIGSSLLPIEFFFAVPCSTANCGTASNVHVGFDLAAAIGETNSSGTPTLDGGYWPGATTISGLQNLTTTGTPTTAAIQVTTTPFVAHAQAGQIIKMTSGAQNGVIATVSDNPDTSHLSFYANAFARGTGVPTQTYQGFGTAAGSGDTFNVYWPATYDGINPSLYMHHWIGVNAGSASFANWGSTNLQQ